MNFLDRVIPPREMLLSPIIPSQSLSMLYAKRGIGKTFLGLGIAHAITSGHAFLRWEAPKSRRVLYVTRLAETSMAGSGTIFPGGRTESGTPIGAAGPVIGSATPRKGVRSCGWRTYLPAHEDGRPRYVFPAPGAVVPLRVHVHR